MPPCTADETQPVAHMLLSHTISPVLYFPFLHGKDMCYRMKYFITNIKWVKTVKNCSVDYTLLDSHEQ
jgi:hypothetical protein